MEDDPSEAQLVPAARSFLGSLAKEHLIAQEVPSPWGRPDLIALSAEVFLDNVEPLSRKSLNIVHKIRGNGPMNISTLSDRLGLAEKTVDRLLEIPLSRGLVEKRDGEFTSANVLRCPEHIIAVEIKVSDWISGLRQARRYKSFADQVYLFLGKNPSTLDHDVFREQGLGVAEIGPHPTLLIEAGDSTKENVPTARGIITENARRIFGSR